MVNSVKMLRWEAWSGCLDGMLRELTHTHLHTHTHTHSNVKMEQEELKMLPLKLGVTHQNLVEARERPPQSL